MAEHDEELPQAEPAKSKVSSIRRGQEIDWAETAHVHAFESAGTIVKFVPPGAPKGFKPYLIEADLSAISGEDIEEWERAGDDARMRANRITFLTKKLAECEDIGDPEDLDESPGSQEAQDLRAQIAEWKAKPGTKLINITHIILPAGIRWNLADDVGPVPIDSPEEISKRVGLMIVSGLATNIVKAINGDTSVIVGNAEKRRMTKKK